MNWLYRNVFPRSHRLLAVGHVERVGSGLWFAAYVGSIARTRVSHRNASVARRRVGDDGNGSIVMGSEDKVGTRVLGLAT